MRRLVDHLLLRLACIVIIADADVESEGNEWQSMMSEPGANSEERREMNP